MGLNNPLSGKLNQRGGYRPAESVGLNSPQGSILNTAGQAAIAASHGNSESFPFKTKLALASICFFLLIALGVAAWQVYLWAFGPTPDYRQMSNSSIQTNEPRHVDEARNSAGFFANIFCRGAQRSSFCD